jgi:hypothetical protein
MSSTLRPIDALEYCRPFIKNADIDAVAPRILDDISTMMWMEAPWRWTVSSLAAIGIEDNKQDYDITLPSDFLYLIGAHLTDGQKYNQLTIESSLPKSGVIGDAKSIALISSTLRLHPRPSILPKDASKSQTIISLYKKTAPRITRNNMTTVGVHIFDDEWFWVFNEGVLWKCYRYLDDDAAGTAKSNGEGKIEYSGQMAIFMAALAQMKAREKLPLMDLRAAPDIPMSK